MKLGWVGGWGAVVVWRSIEWLHESAAVWRPSRGRGTLLSGYCRDGTVLEDEFGPSFLRNFTIANKRKEEISSPKQSHGAFRTFSSAVWIWFFNVSWEFKSRRVLVRLAKWVSWNNREEDWKDANSLLLSDVSPPSPPPWIFRSLMSVHGPQFCWRLLYLVINVTIWKTQISFP